jgi:hypothetical protein
MLLEHLKESVNRTKNEYDNLEKAREDLIKQLKKLLFDIRSGKTSTSEIGKTLNHKDQTTLIENTRKLVRQIEDAKVTWLPNNCSKQQNDVYYDKIKDKVDQINNEQTLNLELITKNQQKATPCSDEERTDKYQSTVPTGQANDDKTNGQSLSPSLVTASSRSENNIINILLLGESGVGKSTFINSFINYLTYKTLNEAESNKPVVLMPVSFLMTTADDFKEHMIELSVSDKTKNEDFRHPGQSVTQRCKSYVFNLAQINGKKLRIIDTPDFGDTRGLDQDDTNMQHILEYINNLTH